MKHFSIAVAAVLLLAAAPLDQPVERAVANSATVAPVAPEIPVALLVDLSSGQTLYAREAERRFVPASVAKVMTAYTAFGLIEQGELALDRPVAVSEEVAEQWSGEGSSLRLKAGDRLTVGELLMGITTVSANDAAVMLAVAAAGSQAEWLALMNANAAQLGLRDTHFATPNGWPDEGRTYTSARDLALLAEALTTRFPGLYRRYFGHPGLTYREITQANHDPISGVVEGADGIKTGFTRESGFTFLGSAERDGRRLVVVLAGAPSASVRDRAARELIEWGFSAFESREILPGATPVGQARVQNGADDRVRLETAGKVLASVPPGDQGEVSLTLRYRGPVEAPIAKGQQVAWLRVAVAGQQPHDVPLVAAEAVAQANPFQRLLNGLVGLLT